MPNSLSKYVIIASPRTGSGFIRSLLNSKSNMVCSGEIFHENDTIATNALTQQVIDKASPSNKLLRYLYPDFMKSRNRNYKGFLNKIWDIHHMDDKCSAYGFKIFENHNNDALKYLIQNKDVKKIVLQRESVLRIFVSEQIAFKTNQWTLKEGDSKKEAKVNIDIKGFDAFIKKNTNYHNYIFNELKDSNQKHFQLSYKTMIESFPKKEIMEFIGVDNPNEELNTELKKQNTKTTKDLIENVDEVATYLEKINKIEWLESI